MPSKPIPQTRKTKTIERTSLQRAANAQGLLNLNPAIQAELVRLNALKRFFNEGRQNPIIARKENNARRAAAEVLREIQEEEGVAQAVPPQPQAPQPLALAPEDQARQPLPPRALDLAPPQVYHGPHTVVPFTNLELLDSPSVLSPYTGGKRSRKNRLKAKKSRKHLLR